MGHKHKSFSFSKFSNRKTTNIEYLIGQVLSITDNKSFKLRYFIVHKFKNLKPYYHPDTSRANVMVKNKKELVLLKDPQFTKQPKDLKQNATSTDKNLVPKWYFRKCIIDTIQSYFEGR